MRATFILIAVPSLIPVKGPSLTNGLSLVKQGKGKEREIIIDSHTPRVPDRPPQPPAISAPSRMRGEGWYFAGHAYLVSDCFLELP